MPFDYEFTQKLVNFGKGLAGGIVGQPFGVYRLNPTSVGDVVADINLVNADLRAKVTHGRKGPQIENETLHTNIFEFLLSSDDVRIADILVQKDDVYGQNGTYAIASFRPLKNVLAVRVDSYCRLYRPQSNRERETVSRGEARAPYSGRTKSTDQPFVIAQGQLLLGTDIDVGSIIPCGIQNVGQIKNFKPEHLPMGVITSWWYIYIPAIPGFERLRENDIIEQIGHVDDVPVRYRINTPYASDVGTAGQFALCERLAI
jgi:hypothetical protein